jgi:dethiobiotin synthetase
VESRTVDARLLRDGLRYWQKSSDIVLVEGAGGLMSPLTDDEYNADLAHDLGYPLVVVVPNRIGAINQALLTLIAAATFKDGLHVAGIVLNQLPTATIDDASTESNRRELSRHCVPPILAEVRLGDGLAPVNTIDWMGITQVVYEN